MKSSSSAKPLPRRSKAETLKVKQAMTMRELARKLPAASRPLLDPDGVLFHATESACLIVLPEVHAGLNAHNKGHWNSKQKLVQALRWKAKTRASAYRFERWPAATIEYRFFFPDAIRRDEANAIQSQKSAIDGVVDSGLFPNDDYLHLHISGVFCLVDAANPRTELLFRRTTTAKLAESRMSSWEFA